MPDDGFIISGGKRIIKNICANYVERFEIQGILSLALRIFFLFDNREKLFQIDSREKFCVLFFGGEHAGGIKVHYGLTKQEQILSSVPINSR